LIKETFIAISHTFSRDTTNPHLPFVPIPISFSFYSQPRFIEKLSLLAPNKHVKTFSKIASNSRRYSVQSAALYTVPYDLIFAMALAD
jgi:hypothetical protein